VQLLSLLVSVVLLATAMSNPAAVRTRTYVVVEAALVLVFALDVTSRWYVQHRRFWTSWTNRAEVATCVFCILAVFFVAVHPDVGTQSEHEGLIALRVLAQVGRAVVYLHSAYRRQREGAVLPLVVHAPGMNDADAASVAVTVTAPSDLIRLRSR
jgi:hypothetical protein